MESRAVPAQKSRDSPNLSDALSEVRNLFAPHARCVEQNFRFLSLRVSSRTHTQRVSSRTHPPPPLVNEVGCRVLGASRSPQMLSQSNEPKAQTRPRWQGHPLPSCCRYMRGFSRATITNAPLDFRYIRGVAAGASTTEVKAQAIRAYCAAFTVVAIATTGVCPRRPRRPAFSWAASGLFVGPNLSPILNTSIVFRSSAALRLFNAA